MKLNVPYIKQIDSFACGAAALEMVYRYYGYQAFSQHKIMEEYKELEPHGTGNYRLTTQTLVDDANSKGLYAYWDRADFLNTESCMTLITQYLKEGVPLIVCQQYTNRQKEIGHFRVVVGIDNNWIYVHDPDIHTGGEYQQWLKETFMKFWQPTGYNVTGGVFVCIKKKTIN